MDASCHARGSATWSPEAERARLEEVAEWYDSRVGLNRDLVRHAAGLIVAGARGSRALELGCANGVMTQELAPRFERLDVVEAIGRYADYARRFVPRGGQVYQCLFEEFRPSIHYDVIVMAWILEHVADPQGLLARARNWLGSEGRIHIVVPNAESLHRQVGMAMGLIGRLTELNPADSAIGHRRVYSWDTLAADIAGADLKLATMEGILLKPLSNTLMETWPRDLRAAFFQLSSLVPRLCSEIYAVCELP